MKGRKEEGRRKEGKKESFKVGYAVFVAATHSTSTECSARRVFFAYVRVRSDPKS